MPQLTDYDRDVIASARKLAKLAADGDVREHTGESDLGMAYAVAFAEAQHLLGLLADRLERLGS
jgi:hypothetical protein